MQKSVKIVRKTKIQSELNRLKKELAKVKLERNILEKCVGCIKASTRVKFEFIDQHLSCFPVKDMCRILDVSTSGYYKWKSKALSKRDQHNLVLLEEIKKIDYLNRKRYGSPRIVRELETSGFHASEKANKKTYEERFAPECF